MAVIDGGGSVAGKANVSAKFSLSVVPETNVASNPDNVGAIRMFTESDPGSLTGTAKLKSPEVSQDFRLRAGVDTLLFNDTFNATTQNTSLWAYTFATMTASQPGVGTVNFGTVQGTANSHGAFMRTFQYFPLIGTFPLSIEFTFGQFTANLTANEEWRVGLGLPSAAGTAPTDGVFLRLTSAGLVGQTVYNNVATSTAVLLNLSSYDLGRLYKHVIVVGEREIEFWRDDILLGTLQNATANGQPFQSAALPIFMQKLCTGVVANTNTMRVSDCTASLMDAASFQPWAEQLSISGKAGNLGQNGNTQGKTSLWGNNAAPTAVALTNTAAAFTGLGGIVAVLPTLTANNDGKLITFQNPAGTINITGRNLVITGVTLDGVVSVVFVGGPVLYAFALAYGHTATSLATPETGSFVTATTHAPRIRPLGIQSYAATAAVGVLGGAVQVKFDTPVVVRPGEFVDIIARNVGTVTSTGAITFIVDIDSYWE